MITEDKIIEIFCLADGFCKLFEESYYRNGQRRT